MIETDPERRRFLGTAAMTIAAARLSVFGRLRAGSASASLVAAVAEAGTTGLREGGFVSVDADGFEAAADWDNLKSPETYVGYDRTENFASRGGADLDRVGSMRRPRDWRSIKGPLLASGRWGRRPLSSADPAGGSSTAFTRATFIS